MGAMPLPVPEPSDEEFQWDFTHDPDQADEDVAFDLLLPADTPLADQLALDDLFDQGFTWEQGLRLLILREHLYEIPEVAERVTGDPHMGFLRWLYARGVYSS